MRAITLPRAMAWLVALGAKTIETRPRNTRYRGPLAIHAAAAAETVTDAYHRQVLSSGGLDPERLDGGVVIAVGRLADCRPITPAECPCYPEYAFGRFIPGWFAWHLADVRILPAPIPARGHAGLWQWHAPRMLPEEPENE